MAEIPSVILEPLLAAMVLLAVAAPGAGAAEDPTGERAALEAARQAFQDAPRELPSALAFVDAAFLDNRPEEALAVLERRLEDDPTNISARIALGRCLRR